MRTGLFSSLRSLLAFLLLLATVFGGLAVLSTSDRVTGNPRRIEAEWRVQADLVAERLEGGLLAVEQELLFAAQSLAIQGPGGDPDAPARLLAAWQRLHPELADALFADRAGVVLAASRRSIQGADVSSSPWFAKALSGLVVGEAAQGSRAGIGVIRNLIVAAPVGEAGAPLGIVAVQLPPEWTDGIVAGARRMLPNGGRGLSIRVMNGSGRSLHDSGPNAQGPEVRATVGDVERGGVGWLVTLRPPETAAPALPLLILLGAGLFAAAVGWLLGGWATCSLDLAEALCRQEGQNRTVAFPLTRDLNRLTGSIRAAIERSMVRERLLQEKRAALARSRDRIRAIRSLSGSTCWEIDLATGKVVWTDREDEQGGTTPERVCNLEDVLAHVEPEDRAMMSDALGTVQAKHGAVREVIVRTRSGAERISGRRLAFRLSAMGGAGTGRIYALSREYFEPLLIAPSVECSAVSVERRSPGLARPRHESAIRRLG
ncbi:hypothetical protein ASF60_12025 [Methylobacterium sp. Leaf113]|uniref:PDC sensor domain-containing protein n=1 Tax=Methylobacterium sp. Leaf113 TaxID=1736259 RepID=UPI0006FFF605|nr:hypothetical protein [Methylobacterium sp. Leaf113]KQP72862.1 hypothetical protein ASF60_12025 [Methylobacterium sp. Leaf113]